MPIDEWPPTDCAAWHRALEPRDILEPGGPASRWSAATVRKHKVGYGRWLGFLEAHDQLDPSIPLGRRVTPERAVDYAKELSSLNTPRTVVGRLEELRDVLRVVEPHRDWAWIGRTASRYGRRGADLVKKRARLQPSTDLYNLGIRLMQESEAEASGTRLERAVRFRDGLLISMLAARPLRRGSLAALQLSDIVLRGDSWWMKVDEDTSKTRTPMEVPLPADLTGAIATYGDEHRPILLRGACCTAFWVSRARRAMGAMSIYLRIVKLTRAEFGVAIHPHLFRDAAATTVAIQDPDHVRVSATLLGHKSLRTTQSHYDQSQMIHACRRFQDALIARRKSAAG